MIQKTKQLPKGWKEVELHELGEINGGGTPSRSKLEYWNGRIPWLKISDLKDFHVKDYEETITKEGLENSAAKLFPKGTILVSIFASLGEVAVLDIESTANQAIAGIYNLRKDVYNLYLAYYLKTLKSHFERIGRGVAQNNINLSILRSTKIPLPPLPIQKRIVSILEKSEKLKQKREEADKLTKEYLQSVFYEMFLNNKDKKNWQELPLSEVVELNPKKSELGKVNEDIEVTFLGMEDIGENGEIFNKKIRKLIEVMKGYTYFNNGDVLFAKITPCMENGKGAIVKINTKIGFGSTEFHVLRPIKDKSVAEWIYFLLSLKPVREQAQKNMTGSAGQKRVLSGFFDILKVHLPPLALQQKFASIVEQVEKLEEKQKKSKDKIDKMFDSLMQKAFNGELVG